MENNEYETWKDIPHFEGKYQASTNGRIRSLTRLISTKGGCKRQMNGRILKQNRYGRYATVSLGNDCTKTVHRLIALTFIQNENNHTQVNHIDGNKRNNAVSNLEWLSGSENMKHAYRTGLQKPYSVGGPKVSICVLKDNVAIKTYNSIRECSIKLGLRYNSICRVLNGKRKHYNGMSFIRV